MQSLQLHGGSPTADTENVKQPAHVLGGWDDDTPAHETLQKVADMMQKLRVDLDVETAFCAPVCAEDIRSSRTRPVRGSRGKFSENDLSMPSNECVRRTSCLALDLMANLVTYGYSFHKARKGADVHSWQESETSDSLRPRQPGESGG